MSPCHGTSAMDSCTSRRGSLTSKKEHLNAGAAVNLWLQYMIWWDVSCARVNAYVFYFTCNIVNIYIYTVYVYTYIHTYIHTYLHTYIPTYLHTYIPTYLHTYIPTYIPTYLHTYIHAYIHTYIHKYIHTYRCVYLGMCVHHEIYLKKSKWLPHQSQWCHVSWTSQ